MNRARTSATIILASSMAGAACNTALGLRDFEAISLEGPADSAAMSGGAGMVDAATSTGVIDTGPIEAGPNTICERRAPEDCTNSIDDDCNGLVDCADPACGAFQCVPTAPTGWFGPVALWEAVTGATVPACPIQFDPLIDARDGLSGPPAACSCTCSPSGQTCSATGTFHADQTCADAPCAIVTPSSSGMCTPIPVNVCGSGGSFDLPSMPVPSGGRCVPDVVPAIPSISWALSARVCFYAGLQNGPGGCTAAAACLPRPTSPYGSTLCIYSSEDPPPSCPVGYDRNPPIVLYSSVNDSRGCTACTCSDPSGGGCAGSIGIFADGACAVGPGSTTYNLGTSCQAYMGVNIARGAVRADYSVTAGTCSVDRPPSPAGTAVPTQPTTVCCL